jgi:hypothetical protein
MSAILSPRGTYRYLLRRQAESMAPMKSTALFIMLNPSTADAALDDPTVRRCHGFAKLWETAIASPSRACMRCARPTQPRCGRITIQSAPTTTDRWIVARECGDVVCAWGSNAKPQRAARVASILTDAGARPWCLGTTKDGSPRHPLYVRAGQPFIRWTPQYAAREIAEGGAA